MAALGPPIFLRARTLSTRSSRLRKNSFWLLRPSQVSKFEGTLTGRAGCSKWPSSKAAASEEANRKLFLPGPPITCQNRCYPRPYGEPLSDARTPLADFFSTLLQIPSDVDSSIGNRERLASQQTTGNLLSHVMPSVRCAPISAVLPSATPRCRCHCERSRPSCAPAGIHQEW